MKDSAGNLFFNRVKYKDYVRIFYNAWLYSEPTASNSLQLKSEKWILKGGGA